MGGLKFLPLTPVTICSHAVGIRGIGKQILQFQTVRTVKTFVVFSNLTGVYLVTLGFVLPGQGFDFQVNLRDGCIQEIPHEIPGMGFVGHGNVSGRRKRFAS